MIFLPPAMTFAPETRALFELASFVALDPRTGPLCLLLPLAALWDLRFGRIPNALVGGGLALGLAVQALSPAAGALPSALGGVLLGLGLFLPLYRLRAMGAGDVKLMAMCGAFLGLPATLWAVLFTLLAGGVLALGLLAWQGRLRRGLDNVLALTRGAAAIPAGESAGSLPYGVAIATGTLGYLLFNPLALFR